MGKSTHLCSAGIIIYCRALQLWLKISIVEWLDSASNYQGELLGAVLALLILHAAFGGRGTLTVWTKVLFYNNPGLYPMVTLHSPHFLRNRSCRKPPSYVPDKGTYVPYDGTFGMPDQVQRLDVWESQTTGSALRWLAPYCSTSYSWSCSWSYSWSYSWTHVLRRHRVQLVRQVAQEPLVRGSNPSGARVQWIEGCWTLGQGFKPLWC
jgi:hypothetical protein